MHSPRTYPHGIDAEICAQLARQVQGNGWEMQFAQGFRGWRIYARRGDEKKTFGPDMSKARLTLRAFQHLAASPRGLTEQHCN